jgi:hypothetical protein
VAGIHSRGATQSRQVNSQLCGGLNVQWQTSVVNAGGGSVGPSFFTDTRMRKFLPAHLSDLSHCSLSRTFVVSFRERKHCRVSIAQWHVYSIQPSQHNDNTCCNHRDFSLVVFRYELRCQYRGAYMFACRCAIAHPRWFVRAVPAAVMAAAHALACSESPGPCHVQVGIMITAAWPHMLP